MNRTSKSTWLMIIAAVLLVASSCTKERIVESTEYIEIKEYILLPGDTVIQVITITDTVYIQGSADTVYSIQYDTVYSNIIDTVYSIQYDTVTIIDSAGSGMGSPNVHLALSALQYYNNPLILQLTLIRFGLSDGWIFYLTEYQTDAQEAAPGVYDIYGHIDYWTPDWTGFLPLEYFWRITHTGGDPAVSTNWELSNSPLGITGFTPGLHPVKESSRAKLIPND